MNVKKTLAGFIAGFALIGSLATPVAIASEIGGQEVTTATVAISNGGVFNATFCNSVSMTETTAPMANAPGAAIGSLNLCYTDTKSQRPAFDATLVSSDFTLSTNVNKTIPASNLKVLKTYNVLQTQWDSGFPLDIGDIGYFVNGGYLAQSSAGATWTANNTLESAKTVNFGYSGVGTVASIGGMDLGLNIPAGTTPGTYVSQLTLSIIVGSQP
jgi:hypothetical protein